MAAHDSKMLLVVLFLCGVTSVSKGEDFKSGITLKQWNEASDGNQKLLVVFYKDKDCASCPAMVDFISGMVGDPDLDEDLQVGKSTDTSLSSDLGVVSYPAVVYLREKSHVIYDGKPATDQLLEWLELSRSKATQHLHDDSFEHLTQASTGATTGDWLVAFYQESCKNIVPLMESLGVRIRQKTNVAAVDVSKNRALADRFNIRHCPDLILFKQGKMYRYEIPKIDLASLKSFVDAWYKNSKAEDVLPPKTKFDHVIDAIADFIKRELEGENRTLVLSVICGIIASLLIITICCCRSVARANTKLKSD